MEAELPFLAGCVVFSSSAQVELDPPNQRRVAFPDGMEVTELLCLVLRLSLQRTCPRGSVSEGAGL